MCNKPKIAYFCMEYGLQNDLKIYAGGLGILAGDYLKAAYELNMPIVGVGILWKQNYTTQLISEDGYPYDQYPNYNFENLIDTGITVSCRIRGADVESKVWKVDKYNNCPLYLLDTDLPDQKEHSWITKKLYGGVDQDRIAQEIILGIGGIRALRKLGIPIDIYHFNEGHAVLAGLELIREKMNKGLSFTEAWSKTRKEVVFTTHTPVEAGNEKHNLDLLMYMEANNNLNYDQLKSIGGEPFNMTVAALRLAYKANAVSELHGKTAYKMWQNISDTAPIISITNGVHVNTWQNEEIKKAFDQGEDLWVPHLKAKNKLFNYIKEKNNISLNPNVLTIGFARRAAAYKRGGLIFKRMDLLAPLLENNQIQLVYSGKAHPNDHHGKEIIQQIINIGNKFSKKITFLENYDMEIAKLMVQGCDIWLNNPLRPMEASGTSGMKAALNGVLNISVLDGWVGEAITHQESGWLLDKVLDKTIAENDQDIYDLQAFYQVLLEEVIPIYYEDHQRWLKMMRNSIQLGLEKLTAQRMVRDYYNKLYS